MRWGAHEGTEHVLGDVVVPVHPSISELDLEHAGNVVVPNALDYLGFDYLTEHVWIISQWLASSSGTCVLLRSGVLVRRP